MNEPIAIRVTRYRCPTCARSHSTKSRCREHIARCWFNPEARGCKTCRHFEFGYEGEECAVGVSLAGRPECDTCLGLFEDCEACGGNWPAVKPGPIVHCDKWEAES